MSHDNRTAGRFAATAAVIFVAATLFGYVIHGLLLEEEYAAVERLFRPEPEFAWLLAGNLSFACAVAYLSISIDRGGARLVEGIRVGLLLWFLWAVPIFLIDYASQPLPGTLIAKQVGLELIDMIALGVLAMLMARRKTAVTDTRA